MDKLKSKILKKIIFPIGDLVMKTKLIYYYNKIKRMEGWSSEKIENWQNTELSKLVNYAYVNSVYYRELFDKLEIKPRDIKSKSDLDRIPVMTREIYIENFEKLISKEINSIPHKRSTTGGTTATPMTYVMDSRAWSFTNADYIVNWERTKYNFGNKYIALGSTSIFAGKPKPLKHKIFYILKNKIPLNGMNINEEILKEYVNLIEKKDIRFIYGYASSIFLLAKYVIKNNLSLKIEGCFPTSEILSDLYRKTILEAFNCKIVNCYGAHDGGITAFEHNEGIFEVGYNTIVSIQNTKDGKDSKGPILLTNLLNYAMPVFNYQLGDEVKLNYNYKNYNGQVIGKVYGRISDMIRLENGYTLTGHSFWDQLFEIPIQAWNLEKKGKNTLLCKIIKQDDYKNSHEKILIEKLKEYAGPGSQVEVEYFDNFELTKSGKRKYYLNG